MQYHKLVSLSSADPYDEVDYIGTSRNWGVLFEVPSVRDPNIWVHIQGP